MNIIFYASVKKIDDMTYKKIYDLGECMGDMTATWSLEFPCTKDGRLIGDHGDEIPYDLVISTEIVEVNE